MGLSSIISRGAATAAGLLCAALGCAALSVAYAQGTAGEAPDYRTWDQYLGGGDSSQYSSLDQINKDSTASSARASDADTGEVLWEHDLPAAQEGVPAVYEVDGRHYVTIPVGGNGLFAGGLNLPEPGPGRYMAFALPARD